MRTLRNRFVLAVSLASFALLMGPRGSVSQEASLSESARVAPGDRVEIDMFTAAGEPLQEVAGTRTVDRDGNLFLPFVGSLDVEGLDASGIRELLERRYADYFSNPVVDVQTRIRVNVTGSVRTPGNYFVDPTSTLLDVLATAGGINAEVNLGTFGAAADPSRVRLVRGQERRTLDLRPESVDDEVLRIRARSGDWLHVPPQTRSRWRDNIQFFGSILSLVGSVATVVLLLGG